MEGCASLSPEKAGSGEHESETDLAVTATEPRLRPSGPWAEEAAASQWVRCFLLSQTESPQQKVNTEHSYMLSTDLKNIYGNPRD